MVLTLSLPEFSCLAKLRGGDTVAAANAALALLRIAHAEPLSHMRIMGAPTLITLAAHMFEFNRSQLRTGASGADKEDTQEQRFGHFFIVVILCVFFSVVTAGATLGPFIAACTYLGVPLGLCAVSVAQGELQLYLATEEASSLVWARPAAWLARALPLLPAALLYLRQS